MRVLITGATGLIGTRVTQLCQEKGIKVNYLTTTKDKLMKIQYNQAEDKFGWRYEVKQ